MKVAVKEDNRVKAEDRPAHEWYRFVLSFPPHLVRDYVERFGLTRNSCVLDPFCGTGTTLVECKRLGIESAGIEGNPMASFASRVKTNWSVDPEALMRHASEIATIAMDKLRSDGIEDEAVGGFPLFAGNNSESSLRTLPQETWKLLLKDSISALPLHKTLILLETLNEQKDERFIQHERLALAKTIVYTSSNLNFGPEVGVGAIKDDAPVIAPWLNNISEMVDDLRSLRALDGTAATVYQGDARHFEDIVEAKSIDAVITSPPYPNEKDYTRTTRLESVLLGFIRSRQDLRSLKQGLVRSNTRGVYKTDNDDLLVADHDEIQDIAEAIEARRIELGKTSGFERLYARVTKLYFGGITRHLSKLRPLLRPGARLAYVVGDQASYLRVMIRTGTLLADIADSLGYEVESIDLFRTRLSTATREQLREEVVVFQWPGKNKTRGKKSTLSKPKMYAAIMEKIFHAGFKPGIREFDFDREEIERYGNELKIDLPKNKGDVVYSFRYRRALPESITSTAGKGEAWIIRGAGRGRYRFALVPDMPIIPNPQMTATKVPDSTPGIVEKYAFKDEQGLLAKVRYNRLIDIFTGVTCYSLQNHLRTTVEDVGQVETDEIYVGVDKKGAHYVFPVQAKGGTDKLGVVQIEQDFGVCAQKFPTLICRPIAAQFMDSDVIALFEFEEGEDGVGISAEKHYKLVPPEEVTDDDLERYGNRAAG